MRCLLTSKIWPSLLGIALGLYLVESSLWAQARPSGASRESALWYISLKAPQSPAGQKAARELLSMAKANPKKSFEMSERLLLVPAFQQGSLGQELRQLRDLMAYQQILDLPSSKERVQRFAEFYTRYPRGELSKPALFRAVAGFEQAGQLEAALELLARQLALDPSDPDRIYLRQEQLRLSERAFLWSDAKKFAEELLLLDPDSDHRAVWQSKLCRFDQIVAWGDAALSCSCLGGRTPSKAVQKSYLDAMKARAEHYRLALFAKKHYLSREDLSLEERLDSLQQIFLAETIPQALREEAKQAILQLYAEHLRTLSPEAREVIAAIAYHSLRDSYQTFDRMRVAAIDREGFLQELQSQKQAFDELERLSSRVWRVADARWGSLVLLKMAEAALHLSSQLTAVPAMSEVDSQQIETELKARQAQLKARAKSKVALAEKAVLRHGVLKESNRDILQLSRTLRDSPLEFKDRYPPATWVAYEEK